MDAQFLLPGQRSLELVALRPFGAYGTIAVRVETYLCIFTAEDVLACVDNVYRTLCAEGQAGNDVP